MVVPCVNCDTKTSSKNKKIIANGKHISMQSNSASLLIIGSGNSVDIERNDGDIKILGDGCRLSVISGFGTIEYIGDGGIIHTGNLNKDKVQYRGDGGTIKEHKESSTKSSNTKNLRVPTINIYNKTNSHIKICGMKKIIGAIQIQVPKIEIRTCKHRKN